MKRLFFLILILSLSLIAFGQYSKVVAVGDSLTAGFMSGGLVQTYQQDSYPALIAKQLGITDFEQPLVSEPGIPALMQLIDLTPTIYPITTDPTQYGLPINLELPRPYDNLAVPGCTLNDTLNTVSDGGGLHDLILRGIGTQVQQAISLNPDLLIVWTGNNDALGAATMGTAIPGVTLTPKDAFDVLYDQLLSTLSENTNADIVVANIPDVTSIPFVTTVPPYIINPETGEVVVGQDGSPVTYLGQNDEGGLFISPDSYVLLTAMEYIMQGYGIPATMGGTGLPLPDEVVLTPNETATIEEYVASFNTSIASKASAYGCALLDTNALMVNLKTNSIEIAGMTIGPEFLTGGFFALDGVHPTTIGYALIANYFIQVIDHAFGKNIPEIGLAPYLFDSPVCCSSGAVDVKNVNIQGLDAMVRLMAHHIRPLKKEAARSLK